MAEIGEVIGKIVFGGKGKIPDVAIPQHLLDDWKRTEKLKADNDRLRNGLRYLSVHLGLSSDWAIGELSRLAWDIAEEGKEAPDHILSKQEVRELGGDDG